MPLYKLSGFNGKYEASPPDDLAAADFVLGHEFAAHGHGVGKINLALAKLIATQYADMPICASESIATTLEEIAPEIVLESVFVGTTADTTASTGGTWKELNQALDTVGDKRNAIIVGHAYHVGRISLQAKKIGLNPLLPPGLPTEFDRESGQWWCRSRLAWTLRELPGTLVLRSRNEL